MNEQLKWIAWEVTPRCNLSCVHCRSSSSMHLNDPLTTAEAKRCLDRIAEFCRPVLVLSGGEPLLRKDIFEIADYGTHKGFRVCMATNGTLIDDECCENMKKTGIKIVSLSLDGSTAEIHDDFRRHRGAFTGAVRGISLLKKHGIEFLINSSFTKRNQHDIENTYKFAKSLGAKAWYLFIIVPTGRGEQIFDELISSEDYDRILRWHYEMEREEEDLLVRPTCAPNYYRVFIEESKKEGMSTKRRSLSFSTGANKGCVAGQTICLIRADGEVLPCSYFPMSGGNIFKQTLDEIWNSPLFASLRSFDRYQGRCGKCEFLKVCGGCRARAFAVSGDYLAEDPYCSHQPQNRSELDD